MIVNELAKAAGVESHVVRYYTRIGLLQPVRHPENGYKIFSRSDIDRLEWIRRAQELGFGLTEIGRFLAPHDEPQPCCTQLRESLERNIERNRNRLVELQALQERMEAALADWRRDQTGALHELAISVDCDETVDGQTPHEVATRA